jgi:SAM-dependent methyltransferase
MRVLDLCCGSGYGSQLMAATATTVVGVDNEDNTVKAAQASIGGDDRLSFEQADAVSYLELPLAERFDLIVCFEGLEHLPELDRVLGSLRRLADAGIKQVISVPNSEYFEEDNPYHLTDFSYETALAAFADFPQVSVVPQFLAEGSVISPPHAESVQFTYVPQDRVEVEYANHFIFCIGFESDVIENAHRGRVQVEVAPLYNRYMRNLAAANSELRRANARLARAQLGKTGSAAAAQLFRREQALDARDAALQAANARAEQAEQDRDAWMQRCLAAESGDRTASGAGEEAKPGPAAERPVQAGGLEVHEVADGLVVYQADPEAVHYLNNSAAVVFQLCTGKNSVTDICGVFAGAFGLSESPIDLVDACVKDLRAKGIVH